MEADVSFNGVVSGRLERWACIFAHKCISLLPPHNAPAPTVSLCVISSVSVSEAACIGLLVSLSPSGSISLSLCFLHLQSYRSLRLRLPPRTSFCGSHSVLFHPTLSLSSLVSVFVLVSSHSVSTSLSLCLLASLSALIHILCRLRVSVRVSLPQPFC